MKKFYLLGLFLMLSLLQANAQCTPPTIDITGTGEICSGNSVTLTATTTGENIKWFNAATGGTQLGTGSTYTTPVLNTTTSFWAESSITVPGTGTPTSGGGKLAPTGTSGSAVVAASSPWGLSFNATQDFVLNSVDVFLSSSTPGNVVIHLKNSSYVILQTVTIAVPAGGTGVNPVQFTLPLNLTIPAGTGYKLVAESSTAMIRDSSSASNLFPYAIGSVGSITGGTINNANTNTTVYYFFYNWNYTPGAAPCVSARDQFTVTVNPTPLAPAVQQFNVCGSGTIADLNTAADILWYQNSTGGTSLSGTTALATGTYYISRFLNTCESARTAVQVNVNAIPAAPATNSYTLCGQTTVAQVIPPGEIHKWYTTADETVALTATAALSNGTYYVSKVVSGCESIRTATTITINDIPSPPANTSYTLCGGGMVGDLIPDGENHVWYASADSTEALETTTALSNGTYYVARTANGCESPRTATTIIINEVPAAPVTNAYIFCGTRTVSDLIPEGENHLWYASADSEEPLDETTELGTDTYFVSATANGCESTRTITHVTIYQIPQIPSFTTYAVCGTQTVGEASGQFTYAWYAQEQDEEPLEDDVQLENGTYYVSQKSDECESPRVMVTVTVNPVPDVPNAEAGQGFENGETLTDLAVEGENLTWYSDENGENEIPDSTVLTDDTTYYVSQTVNGCESALSSITVNEILSHENVTFKGFSYSPNPTNGKVMLTNSNAMESISVYTLVGQKVFSNTVNVLEYELDMTALADGTYMVSVQSGTTVKNIKIVKK